jgi:hypothetical protein
MKNEKLFSSLQAFMFELKKSNIDKIVFAETDEKRAVQKEEKLVEVVRYRELNLLAYRDAVIYKCVFNERDLLNRNTDDIYQELCNNGFGVTRRNRNIT